MRKVVGFTAFSISLSNFVFILKKIVMPPLSDYIVNTIVPLESTSEIADAQDLFLETEYSHLPITENGVYVGCLQKEKTEATVAKKAISECKIDFDRFFVRSTLGWLEVLEELFKNNATIVPVLDDKNKYLGYYEQEDFLAFIKNSPFIKEQGSSIVVTKDIKSFSIGEVVQIVESTKGIVLGIFVSNSTTSEVEITIKMATNFLNDTLQSFRRYNYEIVSEHQEDAYLENLKERSEYLEKYLSI